MSLSRRLLVPGLILGALIRLAALPTSGSGDVLVWKLWSFAAAHDVTAMYGIGGSPPERRVLHWQGDAMTVDYPPLALYELDAVGRAYQWAHPLFEDSRTLDAAVKLPGLACEVLFVGVLLSWGRRTFGEERAARAALFFWLNPAVMLDGSILGYLDAEMAIPAVLALAAIASGEAALGGALLAAAILTKAQAIVVAPVIVAALARRVSSRGHAVAAAAVGAGLTTAVLVGPYALRGAWSNLTQALGRLATHDMLSAQAANIWWLFTYGLRVIDVWGEWGGWRSITQNVRILAISRAIDLGYPNARVVGLVLLGVAIGAALWRQRRATTLADAAAAAGWSAWAYALLCAQVHENHLYLAVPFLALAAGLDRRYTAIAWTVSLIATLNLYLFEGFGSNAPPLIDRAWTLVDMSVVLAIVNVAAFIWHTTRLARGQASVPLISRTNVSSSASI